MVPPGLFPRRCLIRASALLLLASPAACQDFATPPWETRVRVRGHALEMRQDLLFGDSRAVSTSWRAALPEGGSALVPEVTESEPPLELMPGIPLSALGTEIRAVGHDRLGNQAITFTLDEGIDWFFQPNPGDAAGMESATGLRFPISRQFDVGVALTLSEGLDPYRTRLSEARGVFGFLDLRF